MKKSTFYRILCLILVITMLPLAIPTVTAANDELNLSAWSAVCMDYDTGEILYAKDIDSMRVPASMTKIMTAYIIYEELEKGTITKDSMFEISDYARSVSYDSTYPMRVPLYDKYISVDQALQNILIPSASATCIVAAENISGSEEAFVQRMNETALRLGMKAEYQNSHGAKVHYMTCRSVAILVREFIAAYPDVLNYTSMTSTTYSNYTWENTNKLLTDYKYEGCDGFKTGTIAESGYCLAATAIRDGRRVITVVMGATDNQTRHTDSIKLLDYGFEELERRDADRENCSIELVNPNGYELRIGAQVNLGLKFTNLSASFDPSFTVYADNNKLGTFSAHAYEGAIVDVPVCLDDTFAGKSSVVIDVYVHLNEDRHLTGEFAVSDKATSSFIDIAYHWAEEEITAAASSGWIEGYSDGTFRPDEKITRAEFVTILARILELESQTENPFSDTQGHWAEETISAMAQAGYVKGYGDVFKPDQTISRQEAAAIFYRVYQPASAEVTDFNDSDQIADYAKQAVSALAALGVLEGYEDGSFRPNGSLTRAECVKILVLLQTTEEP